MRESAINPFSFIVYFLHTVRSILSLMSQKDEDKTERKEEFVTFFNNKFFANAQTFTLSATHPSHTRELSFQTPATHSIKNNNKNVCKQQQMNGKRNSYYLLLFCAEYDEKIHPTINPHRTHSFIYLFIYVYVLLSRK